MSDEREKETKTKEIIHPMEDVFDIEPGTTLVEYEESLPTVLVVHEEYDNKDVEIEDQFQEVYQKAMDAFEEQSTEAELVDGKYKARNAEVAAQYLNTALHAVKEKSNVKQHKDKQVVAKEKAKTPGTVNQNLFVDRNDLLKALQAKDDKDETE